jgi:DNA-directed RNA polymerase subunit L
VNTLRRVALTNIPTYIFNKINVSKNTSVYHNDYLRLRIRNISLEIPNDNTFFEEKIIDKEKLKTYEDKMLDENVKYAIGEDDIDMTDRDKIDESLFTEITMYLSHHNNSDKIIQVTTEHCKFYQNTKEFKNPFKEPVIILDLQPNQRIELSAITELGIEAQSSLFSALSRFGYKQIKDDEFSVHYHSSGQLTEKRIMEVICDNINKQMKDFLDIIPAVDDMENKIEVHDIDHTLGNLISSGMLKHKNIDFCSYNMPHYLDTRVFIKYKLNNGKLKNVITDVVNYYTEIFTKIKKAF